MAEAVRVWLVERTFDDKGLLRLVYATPEGDRQAVRERSAARLGQYDVTAAIDAEADDLAPVEDEETQEWYADEASRMQERHEPDDTL